MSTSREDWLAEGLVLLKRGRFDALTVETLCERLARTKGAFYHHFDGIGGFKRVLLAAWEETHTLAPIRGSDRNDGRDRRIALRGFVAKLDPDLERAVRAWATIDKDVRAACAKVDEERIRYLATTFTELSAREARRAAEQDYAILIGRLFIYGTLSRIARA